MTISNLSTQMSVHEHPPGCAIGLVVTSYKMSNFTAGHHGHSGVHVMHHSANTDVYKRECQPDNLSRPSLGCNQIYETIPISVCAP